ncbi:MAG: PH domain-containing protein [Phycisphaerales bacterium]|nr:PH domain-containing protein [Phycisphaerales bacterium]
MPSDKPEETGSFQRLHPTSLLFTIGGALKGFLVPALIFLVLRKGEGYEFWGMLIAVPVTLYAVFKYISLRYRLGDEELIVKEGIFNRTERHVPYQRIQNIDTKRNIVHRFLKVTDVIVQTASGTAPEATLRVLSDEAADVMRKHVFARRTAPSTTPTIIADGLETSEPAAAPAPAAAIPEDGRVVARARIRDLIVFGIISNRGMLAVAALLGVFWQFDVMPSKEQIGRWAEAVLGVREWTWLFSSVVVIVGILTAVVLLRLLSILWAVLSLYDFKLLRDGDELRTRFGLLTEHALAIPRHRIQLMDIEATLLHRWFKRVAIRARTAGAIQNQEAGTSRDWLMPILRRSTIPDLLSEVQPELDYTGVPWRPVERRARRRVFAKLLFLSLAVTITLGVTLRPWGWLTGIPLIPLAWLYAHIRVKSMGYALTSQAIWFKSGWFYWRCRAVRYSKIQAVTLIESPFDRRHRMASVKVDTANAGTGTDAIAIPYLNVEDAKEVHGRLKSEAVGTEFKW